MQCIKEMKMGKAPGPDNINTEILKASPELIAKTLLNSFSKYGKLKRFQMNGEKGH
jgi:hypothetical protein